MKPSRINIKTFEKRLYIQKLSDRLNVLGLVLRTKWLGKHLAYLNEVDSTNRYVKACAVKGAPHGFVAIAERQAGGRGRFDRAWFSPSGCGIYFSLLLRPRMPLGEAPRLTIMAALAVSLAIEREAGLKPEIKWPNDVLLGGKKCCGILLEVSAKNNVLDYVVLGIGINVNTPEFPNGVNATSVAIECGEAASRPRLAAAVLYEFETLMDELEHNGFEPILKRYRERSCTLGNRITVTEGEKKLEGVASGFDEIGFLLLRLDGGGVVRVSSGDVTLRG